MHDKVKSQKAVLPPRCNTSFQETKTNTLNYFHCQLPQQDVETFIQFKLRNVL